MTAQNRSTLKQALENGDTFDQTIAGDMVDSAVNLTDTTAQSMSSDLTAPKFIATTEVSAIAVKASAINASTVSAATFQAAGSTLSVGASSLSIKVPTTGAGAQAASASSFLEVNLNGTTMYLAAFTSV